MRPNEVRIIGALLQQQNAGAISPCLNLGSSIGRFRTEEQPHIDQFIFAPLRDSGIQVIDADIKEAEGVDLVGDIYDPATIDAIHELSPASVLCCNMFEHVMNRQALASCISLMLQPGGLLIVTVPFSYPIHYDPIDTNFRPSPSEIHGLFPALILSRVGLFPTQHISVI